VKGGGGKVLEDAYWAPLQGESPREAVRTARFGRRVLQGGRGDRVPHQLTGREDHLELMAPLESNKSVKHIENSRGYLQSNPGKRSRFAEEH